MATKLKPIGHEDRLSIVEHLTELRSRIIICVAPLVEPNICISDSSFSGALIRT